PKPRPRRRHARSTLSTVHHYSRCIGGLQILEAAQSNTCAALRRAPTTNTSFGSGNRLLGAVRPNSRLSSASSALGFPFWLRQVRPNYIRVYFVGRRPYFL